MTDDDAVPAQPTEPLEAAAADLARLRELLIAAGRGEADATDVKESLQAYVATHEPSIRAAATSLTEEVRRHTLEELYKWRAQLEAQLRTRQGADARGGEPTASAPRDEGDAGRPGAPTSSDTT